jgi:hypothetical protein
LPDIHCDYSVSRADGVERLRSRGDEIVGGFNQMGDGCSVEHGGL